MREIAKNERLVANIHDEAAHEQFVVDGKPMPGETMVQLDATHPLGVGFHVYRMAPGVTTIPHEHTCNEQFLILEGDLTDNDGYEYKPGDLVLLRAGTQHCSTTRNGCLLAVFIATPEKNL